MNHVAGRTATLGAAKWRWVAPLPGSNPAARAIRLDDFALESGAVLDSVSVSFQTWGRLNADASNAILVEHALTGDAHVVGVAGPDQPTAGWWPGLIGAGAPIDERESYVVAINVLGGCRGTTGPASAAPDGQAWGSRFPNVSIRDQVRVEAAVADALGVGSWQVVLGGSMGGMRVLEWVASFPERTRAALAIATTPVATGDQIAWAAAQTAAITADPAWQGGDYHRSAHRPDLGLSIARQIAHTTYRSSDELNVRFGNRTQDGSRAVNGAQFSVESYLAHQGAKLTARFDAGSYVHLTRAMSTHDITRDRGDLQRVLGAYGGLLRVAAVDSDRLFPPDLAQEMLDAHGRGHVRMIHSRAGHDGFLIETDQIGRIVRETLQDCRSLARDFA